MTDDYQSIPVAVARAAVQESGQLEGVEGPLFLAEEGAQWLPFFSKTLYGADAHPEFAKVTVTRKGQKPREVVIAWGEYAEQMDADPAWDAIRASKPMAVFGGEAERHSYKVVFADVLDKLERTRAPRPDASAETQTDAWEKPRAWRDEIASADASALDALLDEARAAGALAKDPELQGAFMDRVLTLEQKPKAAPTPAPVPRPQEPRRDKPNRRRR